MPVINPTMNYNYGPDRNGVMNTPLQTWAPSYQQHSGMIFVRGINEAANYPAMQPVLLMDANESVFYIKDANGLRVFDYAERNQNGSEKSDYVTRAEFDELKKMLDELTK